MALDVAAVVQDEVVALAALGDRRKPRPQFPRTDTLPWRRVVARDEARMREPDPMALMLMASVITTSRLCLQDFGSQPLHSPISENTKDALDH